MATDRDYYATLQLHRNATADDIERAYRRLAAQFDPQTSRKAKAAQRFAEITAAYETLSDRDRRRQYDRELSRRAATPGALLPSDVLNNRIVLVAAFGVIVSIAVALTAVLLLAGGGNDELVIATGTATPIPTVTPEGQTPAPTPPETPPAVSAEPTTTASGLQIITIEEGTGDQVAVGDTAYVDYTGWLEDTGTRFDSSIGRSPFQVTVGGGVIQGWTEGLQLMKEGGTYRLIIPSDLGYGDTGSPPQIPPGATLVFDMHIVDLLKPGETLTPTPAPTPTPTAAPATDTAAAPDVATTPAEATATP